MVSNANPVNNVVHFVSGALFPEENLPSVLNLVPGILKAKLLWNVWRYGQNIEQYTDKRNLHTIIGTNFIDYIVNKSYTARCISYLLVACYFANQVTERWEQIKLAAVCRNNAFWGTHLVTLESNDDSNQNWIAHRINTLFPSVTKSTSSHCKNYTQCLQRTIQWQLIYFKHCLLMVFELLSLCDALCANPLNPKYTMRVGKVIMNGEDMMNKLIENQESGHQYFLQHRSFVDKLLKAANSPVTAEQITEWLQKSIQATKKTKKFVDFGGEGFRLGYLYLLKEFGLKDYIPKGNNYPQKEMILRSTKDLTTCTTVS